MAKSPYSRFGTTSLAGTTQILARHTVLGGETLPSIAAKEYGTGYDAELWRQIAEYNDVDDLDAVTAGTIYDIPPPSPATT